VDHPFISTLLRSGPVGQAILAFLLGLSVYTWTVIFAKAGALRGAHRASLAGVARFREAGAEWFETHRAPALEGPVGRVLSEGMREYRAQMDLGGGRPLDADAVARLQAALESEIVDRINQLEHGHIGLGICASASPFIGLFGTVWGIMNSFRGMSLSGSAGIAAVAPGIAEALITTAAGIGVAIPAVVAYNLLNRRVQLVTSVLDRFAGEFVRAAAAASRRGGARVAPTAAPSPAPEASLFARRNV
jgi:biopolymer transport protein TolQ